MIKQFLSNIFVRDIRRSNINHFLIILIIFYYCDVTGKNKSWIENDK